MGRPGLGQIKKAEHQKCSAFFSETVPLLRKRQSTSGVLPFLFGQVQGGIHCPTWARDSSLRLHWVGVRNGTSLEKKAEHFWCSAFFIWPSPGRNPLPDLGK